MDPNQLRVRQLQSQGAPGAGGAFAGKIAPEMKELLVKQAAERAAAQTAADIDAHNARIELGERHAEEAKQLAATLTPPETTPAPAPKHERHHRKGK